MDDAGRPLVPVLGFTATFGRADGLALGKVFHKIAWHSDWTEMIKAKWLAQLQFTTVKLGDALDLSRVRRSSDGEFSRVSLAKAVDQPEVTDVAVQAWLDKALNRRSMIVFAVNIKPIISIVDGFRAAGIDARLVHEKVKVKEREAVLQAFRNGEFPVLVNCGILTEGADFPVVDCVLLARPTTSPNLFIQMIGRGLRLSPETGKTNCLILDLVGSSTKGLACTPTLFGIDPDSTIEGHTAQELEQLAEEQEARCKVDAEPERSAADFELEYKDYSIFDLVPPGDERGHADTDALTGENVRAYSRNAWVGIGNGRFVLDLRGNNCALVEAAPGESWCPVMSCFFPRADLEREVCLSRGAPAGAVVSA